MTSGRRIQGGVLATVIVASILILLTVAGIMTLWESDSILYSRTRYLRSMRANIESAFTLYCAHPAAIPETEFELFEGNRSSNVTIDVEPWGLYELVTAVSSDPRIYRTGIIGARESHQSGCTFYYPDQNASITLTGYTNLHGNLYLPRNGIIYGQMNSIFFNGEEIRDSEVRKSVEDLPGPMLAAGRIPDSLLVVREANAILADSVRIPFYGEETAILDMGTGEITWCNLSGRIVLQGEKIRIDSTCRFNDIIVICRTATVGRGFEGSMQIFATDTVMVEPRARLLCPSGIYSGSYVKIDDGVEINGYVVVKPYETGDIPRANYISSIRSVVRGLVWVNGYAQLQGIVSGAAFVKEAVYSSSQGYYKGVIHDFTILENPGAAYPVWMDSKKRTAAKWVR